MNEPYDMAKEVLGIGPYEPLPEENEELTTEQRVRFDKMIAAECGIRKYP